MNHYLLITIINKVKEIDMDYFEITYEEELSDCCGAKIYADIMMCQECKEYCEPFNEEDNED